MLSQIIFYCALVSFALYVLITSIKYLVLKYKEKIVYEKIISKYNIPDVIDLDKYGFILTSYNPYKFKNIKQCQQLPVHHDIVNIKPLFKHFCQIIKSNLYQTGPFYTVFFTGPVYPLRQLIDVPKYFFYQRPLDQKNLKVFIQNLGEELKICVSE